MEGSERKEKKSKGKIEIEERGRQTDREMRMGPRKTIIVLFVRG